MSSPARPGLRFDDVAQMVADVDRLRGGYERSGQWELPTMLDHLAKSMGQPFKPGRSLPWPANAIGGLLMHRMVARGRYFSVRVPMPPMFWPTRGVTLDDAYGRFREAAGRLGAVSGPTLVVPPLGRLPTVDYVGVQLLHSAHHLAFLRPTAA